MLCVRSVLNDGDGVRSFSTTSCLGPNVDPSSWTLTSSSFCLRLLFGHNRLWFGSYICLLWMERGRSSVTNGIHRRQSQSRLDHQMAQPTSPLAPRRLALLSRFVILGNVDPWLSLDFWHRSSSRPMAETVRQCILDLGPSIHHRRQCDPDHRSRSHMAGR